MSSMHCPACGCVIDREPRSLAQHRRYFAMVRAAYYHWPEYHSTQFDNEEQCRKWLQMKAGHREVAATIPLDGISKDVAMMLAEAAIKAAGSYAVPVIHGDTLVIWRPKSIAFGKLKHREACRLFDDVASVIKAETGLDPEEMLRGMEHAA